MTQTLYAHMNKIKIKNFLKKKEILYLTTNDQLQASVQKELHKRLEIPTMHKMG
jgi:hypothetical protein